MIPLDTILFKLHLLKEKGDMDEALLVLQNAIEDDFVNTEDEKRLAVQYLQLLLIRKSDEDIEKFKKWIDELKEEDYDPIMTEYVYSFTSYLMTFKELKYEDEYFKKLFDIISLDKKSTFYIQTRLNSISYFIQNPEERYTQQVEAMNEFFGGLNEEETIVTKEWFKEGKMNILSKEKLNSDDNRMLELFYILDI